MSWSFAGTLLASTGAYQVTDLSGAQGMPVPKGDNPDVPQRNGRVHREKFAEQRRITLGMLVYASTLASFEGNLDTLKALFSQRSQRYLTRNMADGSARRALAEVVGDLQVAQITPTLARLTVDFLLADPFFYDTDPSEEEYTLSSASNSETLTSAGTADNWKAVIIFEGPLNQPKITNDDTGATLQYLGSLSAGETVTLNCETWTAEKDVSGTITNVIGSVAHDGAPTWWVIHPGDNALTLETTTTTGGTITFQWNDAFA